MYIKYNNYGYLEQNYSYKHVTQKYDILVRTNGKNSQKMSCFATFSSQCNNKMRHFSKYNRKKFDFNSHSNNKKSITNKLAK